MFPLTNGKSSVPIGARVETRTFSFCDRCGTAPKYLAKTRHHLSDGCHECLGRASRRVTLDVYLDSDDSWVVIDAAQGATHVDVATYGVKGHCTTQAQGNRLHQALDALLTDKRKALLNFSGCHHLSTTFLAAAIGRLFATHGKLHVTSHLFVTNIVPGDNEHLFLVMRVANMKQEIDRSKHVVPGLFEATAVALAA